ncbi:MAG: endoribonuclease [Paenibacillus sp.]|nr:endoribonuclease [Paenibacillus sp.]
MKQEIRTTKAPMPAGPYSQGLRIGNRVYVAGQGPKNPETGVIPETIEEQTRQVLLNVQAILHEAGATMDDVVKVTTHLRSLSDFDAYNSVYVQFFNKPYPVRTTVGSELRNMLVEIDVIAELEE